MINAWSTKTTVEDIFDRYFTLTSITCFYVTQLPLNNYFSCKAALEAIPNEADKGENASDTFSSENNPAAFEPENPSQDSTKDEL